MYGYILSIYKKDSRCKRGWRFIKDVDYPGYSGHAMMDEIKWLRTDYPKDMYRLDFNIDTRKTVDKQS
jgi:hypothetical protein